MVQFRFKFAMPGTDEVLEAEMPLERPEDLAGLSISIPDYAARAQLVEFVRQLMQQASDAGINAGRSEARAAHEADIAKIGERLIWEADDRGYCSAYDDVIEDLNRSLTVGLPMREMEYDVTTTYQITTTQRVTARSECDAESVAFDSLRPKHLILPEYIAEQGVSISSVEYQCCEADEA